MRSDTAPIPTGSDSVSVRVLGIGKAERNTDRRRGGSLRTARPYLSQFRGGTALVILKQAIPFGNTKH